MTRPAVAGILAAGLVAFCVLLGTAAEHGLLPPFSMLVGCAAAGGLTSYALVRLGQGGDHHG